MVCRTRILCRSLPPPGIMGPTPEHLPAVVTYDVPGAPRKIWGHDLPRHCVTAGGMKGVREPTA